MSVTTADNNVLASRVFYFIVKAAGPNGPDADYFVANNTHYWTREGAELAASELAKKTPGNRYYVVQILTGYMTPVVDLQEKVYA